MNVIYSALFKMFLPTRALLQHFLWFFFFLSSLISFFVNSFIWIIRKLTKANTKWNMNRMWLRRIRITFEWPSRYMWKENDFSSYNNKNKAQKFLPNYVECLAIITFCGKNFYSSNKWARIKDFLAFASSDGNNSVIFFR